MHSLPVHTFEARPLSTDSILIDELADYPLIKNKTTRSKMKKYLKYIAVASCLVVVIPQLRAQGYIVPNGIIYNGLSSSFGYEISVLHDVANTNYTQFFLNPQGKTQPTIYINTFSFNEFADVGVRVFFVSPNDPISLQPILSQNYTELALLSSYVFSAGAPFYVGLYTGYNFAPPYPPYPPYTYLDPVFGWAELENVNGTIELLDSALEYQGGGIYTGTDTIIPIPEPSEFALTALGALLIGFRRSRDLLQ
jgi:hypothetical protein